jgi:hypothetical protein
VELPAPLPVLLALEVIEPAAGLDTHRGRDVAHGGVGVALLAEQGCRMRDDVRTRAPEARILLDNLPGYPDNLMCGRDGRIWVGLAKPRNATIDKLAQSPFIRR